MTISCGLWILRKSRIPSVSCGNVKLSIFRGSGKASGSSRMASIPKTSMHSIPASINAAIRPTKSIPPVWNPSQPRQPTFPNAAAVQHPLARHLSRLLLSLPVDAARSLLRPADAIRPQQYPHPALDAHRPLCLMPCPTICLIQNGTTGAVAAADSQYQKTGLTAAAARPVLDLQRSAMYLPAGFPALQKRQAYHVSRPQKHRL